MSPTMDTSAAYTCTSCDRDMGFFFGEHDEPEDGIVCPICHIQQQCQGACGITDEETAALDHRVVARVTIILDMLGGLEESLECSDEMFAVGTTPSSGMDVDLSEHHLTSEVIGRLAAVGTEIGGAQRAIVRTLPEVLRAHNAEASYAINHHPMGRMVHHELARMTA